MELTSFLQTIFLNVHQLLTLFALSAGSFAVGVFMYQVGLEQRRKLPKNNLNEFTVFDE